MVHSNYTNRSNWNNNNGNRGRRGRGGFKRGGSGQFSERSDPKHENPPSKTNQGKAPPKKTTDNVEQKMCIICLREPVSGPECPNGVRHVCKGCLQNPAWRELLTGGADRKCCFCKISIADLVKLIAQQVRDTADLPS